MRRSLLGKIAHLALTGKIGFRADEVMTGTYHAVANGNKVGKDLPMEFRVTWGSDDLVGFVRNILAAKPAVSWMHGVVDIGGFCKDAPIRGKLELNYFGEGIIRYTFDFALRGHNFRYIGEKRNLRPWNLHKTHTTCYGTLYDLSVPWAGGPLAIAESVTHFRLRTAPAFVASFRLT